MSIEAMKQALDCLQSDLAGRIKKKPHAIASLRQAIEQAEKQEPVALAEYDAGSLNDYGGGNVGWWWDYIRYELGRAHDHYQEQVTDLYTHPQPQRKWVGLTGFEQKELMAMSAREAVFATEAKLKELNHVN